MTLHLGEEVEVILGSANHIFYSQSKLLLSRLLTPSPPFQLLHYYFVPKIGGAKGERDRANWGVYIGSRWYVLGFALLHGSWPNASVFIPQLAPNLRGQLFNQFHPLSGLDGGSLAVEETVPRRTARVW